MVHWRHNLALRWRIQSKQGRLLPIYKILFIPWSIFTLFLSLNYKFYRKKSLKLSWHCARLLSTQLDLSAESSHAARKVPRPAVRKNRRKSRFHNDRDVRFIEADRPIGASWKLFDEEYRKLKKSEWQSKAETKKWKQVARIHNSPALIAGSRCSSRSVEII